MTPNPAPQTPTFDKDIPIPRKGKAVFYCRNRAYLIAYPDFPLAEALRLMEVGDSCLLSNWATTSVHYVSSKTGRQFQRQLQPDGMVRIWRIS